MNTKVLLGLVALIVIVGGGYLLTSKQTNNIAPAQNTSETSAQTSKLETQAEVTAKPDAHTGAAGVSDPTAPKGTAEQCGQCNEYQGAQKGQCLVALNC